MRWIVRGLGALLVAALVGIGLLGWTFSGMGAVPDRLRLADGAVEVVADGYTSAFILDAGDGRVALVDAGMDPDATALRDALAAGGRDVDDVIAIFLTHGHGDHVAGVPRFPRATVYAMAAERPLLEGQARARGPLTGWFPAHDSGVRATPVEDGATVRVGALDVRAFAVPGHTDGSAAWLAHGVLFLGDSADALADGSVVPAKWLFTDDPATNLTSLEGLATALDGADVRHLAFAHSGVVDGAAPLRRLVATGP